MALVVLALALTSCGGEQGRVTASPSTAPVASVSLEGVADDDPGAETTSTAQPTTAPAPTTPAAAAPVTSAPCEVPAGGAVPAEVAGYTVVPDDSGALNLLALPPGMQASGFVHVRRADGAVVDVAALAGSGYAFGDLADVEVLDRFARSIGVVEGPLPVPVGRHTGVVARTTAQMTVYAWMPCRNILEAVIGADAAMAADVAARLSG